MRTASEVYTHGHADNVLRSHRWRTAENSAGYLLPHLVAGQRILDLGCGPGTITVDIARRVAPGEVIGLDLADEPLQEARAAATAAGLNNVTFVAGDAYDLDHPDDSFDIVHTHQLLQHLSDPVAALAEMRRVCVPGGWVAARDADYAAMTWHPADERLDRWLELYRQVARSNDGEPDAGRRLLAWAQAAGLAETMSSASVWCFSSVEDRAWWGGMWAQRITDSALADQAVSRGLATQGELADLAEAWLSWSHRDDGWFAVLHGEILAQI